MSACTHEGARAVSGLIVEWCPRCGAVRTQATPLAPWTPWTRPTQAGLADVLGAQLGDIGETLVDAGVLTAAAIARDGVRFAVKRRFAPEPALAPKKEAS